MIIFHQGIFYLTGRYPSIGKRFFGIDYAKVKNGAINLCKVKKEDREYFINMYSAKSSKNKFVHLFKNTFFKSMSFYMIE